MAARMDTDPIAALEELNHEASRHHIWLRTRANAPQHLPWHVGAVEQMPMHDAAHGRALPHLWKWRDIEPYLHRIAEIAPLDMTERQQFLLTNPGFGGRLQIAPTIRIAISIYKPGDNAEQHLHTPNASRTILSHEGGYTIVDGERCDAARGDLILTPHGTWHGHGNDSAEPVIWMDVLDWPLIEYLDCVWSRSDLPVAANNPPPTSHALYGAGGMVPRFARRPRGDSVATSPMIHYRGADVRQRLDALRKVDGSPYDGVALDFADPVTGGPLFPTLAYGAQLLRPGEATLPYRDTASTVFVVLAGSGTTEVNGKTLAWEENDVFVVPPSMWRTHENGDEAKDAILYSVTDAPLLQKIGQFRTQGRDAGGHLIDLPG